MTGKYRMVFNVFAGTPTDPSGSLSESYIQRENRRVNPSASSGFKKSDKAAESVESQFRQSCVVNNDFWECSKTRHRDTTNALDQSAQYDLTIGHHKSTGGLKA
jgi:hypothetical protein